MTRNLDCINEILNEFGTDKEVECAVQMATVVMESGIQLTRKLDLLLRLLQVPALNFFLNAKATELTYTFRNDFPELSKKKTAEIG